MINWKCLSFIYSQESLNIVTKLKNIISNRKDRNIVYEITAA